MQKKPVNPTDKSWLGIRFASLIFADKYFEKNSYKPYSA